MKIQSSRDSHRTDKRYSGVYQQVGRMITDADWNELMAIVTERRQETLGDLVQSGIPRLDGLTVYVGAGMPPAVTIKPGHLYAGGVLARLPGNAPVPYRGTGVPVQNDFPDAPPLPATLPFRLYADVWDRTLTSLEDGDVRDAALHGADTCARTQTMVQIKWCPDTIDPEDPAMNPPCGNAPLTLTLQLAAPLADPCDPCATEELGDDPARIGNYLFRVEVHDVTFDGPNIDELTLKWSSENGAEQYDVTAVPEAYRLDDKWAFEFFSATTERHLGVHHAAALPKRGALTSSYPQPVDPQYQYVRRWDGFAVLQRRGGGWVLDASSCDRGVSLSATDLAAGDHGRVDFSNNNNICVMYLNHIQLKIALNSVFVAGDYWTAPVREATDGPSKEVLSASPPIGIVHRYLMLGRVVPDGGGAKLADPPNDAALRRLNFPSLTTLRATDVGVAPNACLATLFGNAQNVQQALDNLCNIDASDIAYDPTIQADRWKDIREVSDLATQPGGPAEPNTVQEALDTLVATLESSDIGYTVPSTCTGATIPRLKDLLKLSGVQTDLKSLWDRVLCDLDAGTIPFDNQCPALYGDAATVDDALKNLCSINTAAITFDIPACTTTPSVRSELGLAEGPATLESVLTKVLCDLNATDVPIEKNAQLQPPLDTAGIDTVQDALNALAKVRAGGCAATVGAGGTYATLAEAFDKLGGQNVITLCLMPGMHTVAAAGLAPVSHHSIKISGAGGTASVIELHGGLVLTADEVILHDVGVRSMEAHAGLTLTAGAVSVSGCVFDRAPAVERSDTLWGFPVAAFLTAIPFTGLMGIPLGGFTTVSTGGALTGTPLGGELEAAPAPPTTEPPASVVAAPPAPNAGVESARAVAVDKDGNTIITGYFDQTLDIQNVHLTAEAGKNNIFVLKISPSGALLWARTFASDGVEVCLGVATDSTNRVIITGLFNGTVQIGKELKTNKPGQIEPFLAQLDGNTGNPRWALSFKTDDHSIAYAVAVGRKDEIVITGYFAAPIDFGKGPLQHSGIGADLFLAKFNSSGKPIWSRSFPGSGSKFGTALAIDGANNILLTGRFNSTVNFGTGVLTAAAAGLNDLFVAKFNEGGEAIWSHNYPGAGTKMGLGIAADRQANVLVTGQFSQSVDFGAAGTLTATGLDAFVAKFDAAGAPQWARNFNGTLAEVGNAIAVDGRGSVIVTGNYTGSIDFGGGILSAPAQGAAFLLKLDSAGRYLAARSFGDTGTAVGYGIAVDGADQISIVGEFSGTIDLGAGAGTVTATGGRDLFIGKIILPGPLEPLARVRPPNAVTTTLRWIQNRMTGLQSALALDTNQIEGVIRDNQIVGTVSVFDPLQMALFRGNSGVFNAGGVPPFSANGGVRFECNTIDQIVTRYNPAALTAPEAFATVTLTDNTFRGRENSFIGSAITASGNHFAALPAVGGYAAVAICRFPIFVGNQSVAAGKIDVAAVEAPQVAANAPRLTITKIY